MIHSSEQPRAFWKLGRVVELVRGRDGQVRGAKLKVSGKGRQATTLHRPIQRLYPLETKDADASKPLTADKSHDPSESAARDPSESDTRDPSESDTHDLSESAARDLSESAIHDRSGADACDYPSIESVDHPISEIMNNEPNLRRRPSRVAAQVARDRLFAQTLMDD